MARASATRLEPRASHLSVFQSLEEIQKHCAREGLVVVEGNGGVPIPRRESKLFQAVVYAQHAANTKFQSLEENQNYSRVD